MLPGAHQQPSCILPDLLHLFAKVQPDLLFSQVDMYQSGHLVVQGDGQHLVSPLHYRDCQAALLEIICHLQANIAGADHHRLPCLSFHDPGDDGVGVGDRSQTEHSR